MEMGYCDRGRDRESDTPAQKRRQTVSNWKPLHLRSDQNSHTDAEHSSDDCSSEQSGLPCCVAQDGSNDCPEPSKDPRSDE